jgi:hypothetical protein
VNSRSSIYPSPAVSRMSSHSHDTSPASSASVAALESKVCVENNVEL